jgi:hypothetical protein
MAAALLFGAYQFVTFEKTAIDTVNCSAQITPFAPLTPTPLPTPRPTPTTIPLKPVWDYNISTVFQAKCAECHGDAAGLDLITYNTTMAGGNKGLVVIVGDPDNSPLVLKQQKRHPGVLTDFELQIVKEWIEAGAPRR